MNSCVTLVFVSFYYREVHRRAPNVGPGGPRARCQAAQFEIHVLSASYHGRGRRQEAAAQSHPLRVSFLGPSLQTVPVLLAHQISPPPSSDLALAPPSATFARYTRRWH